MKDFTRSWANGIFRFRWLIIALTPVVMFFASAPAKNIYFAHSPDMWFLQDDPAYLGFQRQKELFGDTQNLLVGFAAADDGSVVDAELLEAVREVHDFLLARDEVVQVQSLVNYQYITSENDTLTVKDLLNRDAPPFGLIPGGSNAAQIEDILKGEPIVLGDLVTTDMKNTALVAELQSSDDGRVDHHIAVVDAVKEFIEVNGYDDKGIAIETFGRPYISHQLTSGTINDQMLFYPLLALIAAAISLFVFRDFRAVMGPFMVIFNSLMTVYAVQGLMGWPTTVANALMPFLVIIIGIGISSYFMSAFYRNLGTVNNAREALVETFAELSRPAVFTTVTTILGFAGVAYTKLQPLREYGFLAMVGVAAAFFFSLFLLPAILSTAKKAPKWARPTVDRPEHVTSITRLIVGSARRAPLVIGVTALLFAASLAATFSLKLDTNFVSMFKEGSEFRGAFEYFDREFKGGQSVEVILDSGSEGGVFAPDFLAKADGVASSLVAYEGFGKARSALEYIKQMNVALNNGNEAFRKLPATANETAQMLLLYENAGPERGLDEFISADQRFLRISVSAQNMSATQTHEVVTALQQDIAKNWPGLKATLTGDLVMYNQLETLISSGFVTSFSLSLATIMLAIFVLFRSVSATLFATLSSVLPIFIGGAVMKLFGIFPDINSLIVASVTIGLAVDDSIHFMVGYENARQRGETVDEAIFSAAQQLGYGMVLSTVILSLGFSIFLMASLQSGVNFGLLSVVIIVTALLADLMVLPALVKAFDRRNISRSVPTGLAEQPA